MLAIGTVYPSLVVGVTLVVVAAFVVALKTSASSSVPFRLSAPALVALALAAYTMLQVVPLLMGMLAKLAPLIGCGCSSSPYL